MPSFEVDAEIDKLLSMYARSKAHVCSYRPQYNTLHYSDLPTANPPPPSKFVRKSRLTNNKLIDLNTERPSNDQNTWIGEALDRPNHRNVTDRPVNGSLDFDLLYSPLFIGCPGDLSTSADLNSKDK